MRVDVLWFMHDKDNVTLLKNLRIKTFSETNSMLIITDTFNISKLIVTGITVLNIMSTLGHRKNVQQMKPHHESKESIKNSRYGNSNSN